MADRCCRDRANLVIAVVQGSEISVTGRCPRSDSSTSRRGMSGSRSGTMNMPDELWLRWGHRVVPGWRDRIVDECSRLESGRGQPPWVRIPLSPPRSLSPGAAPEGQALACQPCNDWEMGMPRMDVTDLPPGTTRHVMSPEPPIRGFIIAGVLSIVGAVLMIISIAKSWHEVVTIIFIAVLACGIALAVTAAWSMVHMKLYVDLDDKGYHIHGAGQDRRGTWDKVTKAALTESRSRLTLYHGQVGRTHIVRPGIGDPKEMDDLAVDVAHRLDESRGYRQNI